jgi:hypothetical protein
VVGIPRASTEVKIGGARGEDKKRWKGQEERGGMGERTLQTGEARFRVQKRRKEEISPFE